MLGTGATEQNATHFQAGQGTGKGFYIKMEKQPEMLALYSKISLGAKGKHRSEELKEMAKRRGDTSRGDRPRGG